MMRARFFDVTKDQTGAALVEFTIVLPVLLFLILGLAQFGLIFYNYIMVTNAAATGARQLALSRTDANAYSDTITAISNAAPGLGLSATCAAATTPCITMSVNGATCSSNSGCQSDLVSASGTVPPQPASVTVSYSCSGNTIMPAYLINLTGVCPLTSTMQQVVE
jgi:Flp pilus assembly protein TadG